MCIHMWTGSGCCAETAWQACVQGGGVGASPQYVVHVTACGVDDDAVVSQ